MVSGWEAVVEVCSFVVFVPLGWPFGVYMLLQGINLFVLRGPLRWASMVPLPFAAAVFVLTTVSYADGSNLWPILLILFGPAACAYETIVSGIGLVASLRRRDSSSAAPPGIHSH